MMLEDECTRRREMCPGTPMLGIVRRGDVGVSNHYAIRDCVGVGLANATTRGTAVSTRKCQTHGQKPNHEWEPIAKTSARAEHAVSVILQSAQAITGVDASDPAGAWHVELMRGSRGRVVVHPELED